MEPASRPAHALEGRDAAAAAASLVALAAPPLCVVAAGAWSGLAGRASPGDVASGLAVAILAAGALAAYLDWRAELARVRPLFAEIARSLGGFQARRRDPARTALPGSGPLRAEGLVTRAVPRLGRLAGIDLSVSLPSHLGLVGGPESGASAFAALLGGQVPAVSGRVTLGGVDIADADPAVRAQRLAYAGGTPFLFGGTLAANLLYGHKEADPDAVREPLRKAVAVAGLEGLLDRRGLAGTVDPRREPDLATSLVAARADIRAALGDEGDALVEHFETDRYARAATIGENILFGVALGDTFREANLPAQPFMRGLLDSEDLTKPLAALGADIARSTLEMFADVPDASSLVGRFALVSAGDNEEIERLLARREAGQRGTASARDTERLIGLALRYCEPRHRLGLLGPALQDRIVHLRSVVRATIPKSLEPAVEFFHPDRLCAAASVRDNLLFGRIDTGRAGAERQVSAAIRGVLEARGLVEPVRRVALAGVVDPAASGLSDAELDAVDLVRCLVREPDTIVVAVAFDHLARAAAKDLLGRLVAARAGRGLIVVLPEAMGRPDVLPHVIAFEGGRVASERPHSAA